MHFNVSESVVYLEQLENKFTLMIYLYLNSIIRTFSMPSLVITFSSSVRNLERGLTINGGQANQCFNAYTEWNLMLSTKFSSLHSLL